MTTNKGEKGRKEEKNQEKHAARSGPGTRSLTYRIIIVQNQPVDVRVTNE